MDFFADKRFFFRGKAAGVLKTILKNSFLNNSQIISLNSLKT